MVFIEVAAFPWYKIYIVLNIDHCIYMYIIYSLTVYDWNARQRTYYWPICSSLFIDRIEIYIDREKGEIWLSLMTKAPTPADLSKGQDDNTNNVTKKFDYTAVADRLRTVSWSNYVHPTGVVNLVYGPNLPTPLNSRVIRRTHI